MFDLLQSTIKKQRFRFRKSISYVVSGTQKLIINSNNVKLSMEKQNMKRYIGKDTV